MSYSNRTLLPILQDLNLGTSVAEQDTLLETARIETSTFTDLLADRVDLVPGTKGSGKSALFRIFTDFLPDTLLLSRKVIVAHGIESKGDPVFHAFTEEFKKLSEDEFVSFWCIYLVSLAHEQFIKAPQYQSHLKEASKDISRFREACEKARIPEIKSHKSLKSILEWTLGVLKHWRPKTTYNLATNEVGFSLFEFDDALEDNNSTNLLPIYVNDIKDVIEEILNKTNLSLWLMIDRLDEIFPRRSEVERLALRGLLKATKSFTSSRIRVKIFLRDDMLEHIVSGKDGFTTLTHITARQADTLKWTESQIQTFIVKRFAANQPFIDLMNINKEKIDASADYRTECFDVIFPPTVYKGSNQSKTLRWITNRCADGRGVVTPRDVLDLLIRARQKQIDLIAANQDAISDSFISSAAVIYGYEQLSKRKRDTYLQAEFPHLWSHIEKFHGGKTEYNEAALRNLLKSRWETISDDLLAIGFLSKGKKKGQTVYSIPFLYRSAMGLTQGSA